MMENKYIDFTVKRMFIFNELVKRYWNDGLNTPDDLEELAVQIRGKYGFGKEEMPFIKNHIRIAMGLDPKGDEEFTNELELVKNSGRVISPVIARVDGPCEYCEKEVCVCPKYQTQLYRRTDEPIIENNKCLSCGECVTSCDFGALADKIEFLPVVNLLKDEKVPVYAAVAPAIVGQFGENVTMGQLRTAFKLMGFQDMIEVALFADILTIKEAIEFDHLVKKEEDFFLTSCCCPVWFNMVKKSYPDMYKHMSPSVSPMIASGRILKKLYPEAKVVFIAPCIAKKAEYKEPDVAGAIDFVLNFRELKEIFDALNIDLEKLPSDDVDHASLGGRLYARTGGVSFSVKTVVNRLEPERVIKLKAKKVDGAKKCKEILDQLNRDEKVEANFIEGMGCIGGCVGGPRTNIDKELGRDFVNEFGEESYILTPFDNQNLIKILEQLGVDSLEKMLENEEVAKLLTRE
jgi:iron only hydrogenase large subunit-like protein